jgi:nuclear GTP-binding protein
MYDLGSEDELDNEMMEDSVNPMAALLASARVRAAEYEQDLTGENEDMDDEEWHGFKDEERGSARHTAATTRSDTSRKTYDKIFKQVVDSADVILYVLDARDPEGTRSKEVERQVISADGGNKRLILILNKIDLIPSSVLKAWLIHLRRYFPTLPLRASNPAPNARTFDHKQLTVKSTSETLFKALKSYAQSKSLKRSVSVGVIGYPNVGKSSVINALTSRLGSRTTSCPTGAEAGVTTGLREVKLDNKLKLLDSPGIVFPASSLAAAAATAKTNAVNEQARLILLNAVPPREIEDPLPAVALLLKRVGDDELRMQKLLDVYGIPPLMSVDGDITTSFLVEVARKRGRLGKGGVPNLKSAAMAVIMDWRDGRIQGWMEPPAVLQVASKDEIIEVSGGDEKIVVKEWAAEFKLEGLWGDDRKEDDDAMLVET